MDSFKDRLDLMMEVKGIASIRQLCQETGIPAATFSRHMEKGALPLMKDMICLSKYFNVSLDWFVFGHADTEYTREEVEMISKLKKLPAGYFAAALRVVEALSEAAISPCPPECPHS